MICAPKSRGYGIADGEHTSVCVERRATGLAVAKQSPVGMATSQIARICIVKDFSFLFAERVNEALLRRRSPSGGGEKASSEDCSNLL